MRKKIESVGSLASIAALLLFVYYQYIYETNSVIEIKIINKEELTKIPTDNNLKVKYSLNGLLVTNLVKIRFSIKNIGNKTIIGKHGIGLITEPLPLKLDGNTKIYGIKVNTNNFPVKLVKVDSISYGLSFKQWRVGEFIEVSAYLGNDDYAKINPFFIEERDIIDGNIVFTEFNNDELTLEPRFIDKLPLVLKKIAWWILVISYLMAYFISIWQFFVQLKSEALRNSKLAKLTFTLFWLLFNIILLTPLLWIL